MMIIPCSFSVWTNVLINESVVCVYNESAYLSDCNSAVFSK